MKYSLLLPLSLISLTFTSCSLIRWVEPESIKTPTENPEVVVVPSIEKEAPVITPDENKPSNTKPNVDKIPTPPEDNAQKSEEVSTEELTKELDAFVDEITKGL
jgi:hypothetical protein